MDYNSWAEKYRPIYNPYSPQSQHFETSGADNELLDLIKYNQIWTMIQAEDETQIVPGYRFANRICYFVTKKYWSNSDEVVVVEDITEEA